MASPELDLPLPWNRPNRVRHLVQISGIPPPPCPLVLRSSLWPVRINEVFHSRSSIVWRAFWNLLSHFFPPSSSHCLRACSTPLALRQCLYCSAAGAKTNSAFNAEALSSISYRRIKENLWYRRRTFGPLALCCSEKSYAAWSHLPALDPAAHGSTRTHLGTVMGASVSP